MIQDKTGDDVTTHIILSGTGGVYLTRYLSIYVFDYFLNEKFVIKRKRGDISILPPIYI